MSSSLPLNKPFLVLVNFLNISLVALALWRITIDPSARSLGTMISLYIGLIAINLVIAGLFRVFKADNFRIFMNSVAVLLILFMPVLFATVFLVGF